ncbi:MAG: FAD-binding oxidoreductase [Colwellia sp.]|nr:FAD-binding oxidoreductase [Colwellia sp.]
MRRWNGWGDESTNMELPNSADTFLQEKLGNGHRLTDCQLSDVIAKVPNSKLINHPLISIDKEQRVRHARGQSLPDWLAMRSGNIDVFPDGVCFPNNREEVQEIIAYAQRYDVELIPYGGGTSVAGHINPKSSTKPILTVDMSHMNQLLHLDEHSNIATFGAGTPGPMVEAQLRAKGYTLGHFPQSFELSTIGGWVASRSSGQQSLRYGRIEQMFAGGTIETFAGSLDLPSFPASSAGPDLREIILGSEGRFGIISEVNVRVSKLAQREDFIVIFFPDWQLASNFCRKLVQQRTPLSMLRVSNAVETQTQLKLAGHEKSIAWLERYLSLRGCKNNKCMLTLGVTGSKHQNQASLIEVKPLMKKHQGISTGTILGKRWVQNRFRFPYLREALWLKGYVVDTLETATNWQNVDNMMQLVENSLRDCLSQQGDDIHVFTHMSHVYSQGCSLYTTYLFRNGDDHQQTLKKWQKLKHAASQVIVNNGGTISHQHGVGKDHAPYLSVEKGQLGMGIIKNLANHFDPNKQLNPGTLIDSVSLEQLYHIDQDSNS